jgi:drug/metabolite transporter (DMT)-like permease
MAALRLPELLAFFAIYVIWGSTYLAIRHAVETIPPLMTAGIRHLIAGLIIYIWARRGKPAVTAVEWRASVVVAALFFLIGHGTLHWAEQIVPSGIAALLVATEPFWIALLMPPAQGSRFSWQMAAGLTAGLMGVALLIPRDMLTAGAGELWGSAAILIGTMSWALGIRYSATAPLPRDPFVRAGTTLLCGAALLLPASLLTGEMSRVGLQTISSRSIASLAYLIVFGSIVAFSAYFWLLERRSATLVATHTYVNPVIAVLLGWLLAGELLTMRIAWATALILIAVFVLKSDSARRGMGPAIARNRPFGTALAQTPSASRVVKHGTVRGLR